LPIGLILKVSGSILKNKLHFPGPGVGV